MELNRKYRQHGYNDTDNQRASAVNGTRDMREPKPRSPRQALDVTGPRLPLLVPTVSASRCYGCGTALPLGTFYGACANCGVQLHCCKQCVNFESSTRFQCLKPVAVRVAAKDRENQCTFFWSRVTVAREVSRPNQAKAAFTVVNGAVANHNTGFRVTPPPGQEARDAFNRLFTK